MHAGKVWLVVLGLFSLFPLHAQAFQFQDVVDKAKSKAGSAYEAPARIPDFMADLSYDDYQSIRFDPSKSLWREASSRFEVMLIPAGKFYTQPVSINVVDSEGVHSQAFDKGLFNVEEDRKSTRLNSSHVRISYAVFCLKKKKKQNINMSSTHTFHIPK